jgi:hypothetical protein
MNRAALFLHRRPWLSLTVTITVFFLMWEGTRTVRSDTAAPTWLVPVSIVFVIYGLVAGLFLVPRLRWRRPVGPGMVFLARWLSICSSYLLAWVAWNQFGAPTWLLVGGGIAATAGLVFLVFTSSRAKATA